MYYQYAASPRGYNYNWRGVAMPSSTPGAYASGLGNYPVSMSLVSGRRSVLHSGPEQGKLSMGDATLEALAKAAAGGGAGATTQKQQKAAQFSRNEKRAFVILGVAAVGYFLWKKK